MRRPSRNGKRVETINTLLVDGNALFKVGYHGAKGEYDSNGNHIGGIYQFITVVRKLLIENLYHRVFVFWDGDLSGKLRYEIYPDYKGNRNKDYINGSKPDDMDQVRERLKVQTYLEELFIRQLNDRVVESDDFIAYFCKTKKDNEKITICTNDSDLCQLVNEDVQIYMCGQYKKYYVTDYNYHMYYKHHLKNSALVKSISGDSSDNIKGIKGVKEATLLKYFPELGEREVKLSEIIDKAKLLQEERLSEKKKPLKALDNIINATTEGIQGKQVYEINRRLVDLSEPMMTPQAIRRLDELRSLPLDPEGRSIKNAYARMKHDGVDRMISGDITEYFLPFKRLINRENNVHS